LYEKTLGIIGLGATGTRVARIARGFGMRVLAYDPFISTEKAKEKGAESVTLDFLLTESDYVTLHVVLNEATRGMIGQKELARMKQNAYLFNASRGPVIDEEALIHVLKKQKISGAGLDVFAQEPINSANPLLKNDNVLVTPHVAGNSKDALDTTALVVSQETIRILSDETPKNLVNRQQLIEKGHIS
jgi:D-3-phosphoglycerate dehydrogenase